MWHDFAKENDGLMLIAGIFTFVEKIEKENPGRGKREGVAGCKMETAPAMLKDDVSESVISKYTGLSEEEIASIK